MTGFIEGKTTKKNLPVKYFGYVISAILIVISTISMMNNWTATPWLFLITMYFLTGSLWIPVLIKPFYLLWCKLGIFKKESKKENDSYFKSN
ncbi:MAG: hypothetical protein P8Y99_12695 [Calditrichaceae bacterium]